MFKPVVRLSTVSLILFSLSGCATDQSEPEFETRGGQVLSSTDTAPADLQLTCSSATASQFGLPPDKVLPVSSSKLPDGNFEVRLASDGSNYVCTVDNNANVVSIVRA